MKTLQRAVRLTQGSWDPWRDSRPLPTRVDSASASKGSDRRDTTARGAQWTSSMNCSEADCRRRRLRALRRTDDGRLSKAASHVDVDLDPDGSLAEAEQAIEAASIKTTSATSRASPMKIDMSPKAVRERLERVSALRRVCLSLARSSAGREVMERCPGNRAVQRARRALGR